MSLLKTVDVTFQGVSYKIRKSMYTMLLFQQELKKNDAELNEILSTMIFAYCALKAYNPHFKASLEEVMMHIDDPENESVLLGMVEIMKDEVEELNNEKADVEKK